MVVKNIFLLYDERSVVMREFLKDAQYYEDYLVSNAKRLARFQEQLGLLESDNAIGRRECAAFIACLYHSRICALYSSGSCIHDLEEIYPLFLRYLVQGVMPAEGYFDVIDAISLGVLLDAKDSFPTLKLIVQQTDMHNKLIDTLLHSIDDTWPIVEANDRCTWFSEFLKCAEIER